MFNFAWPWVFLLLPLPILLYRTLPQHQRQSGALRVPFFHVLANFESSELKKSSRSLSKKLILCAIWLLCIGAAARPQWVGEPINFPTSGRDLMLVVDLSGSMEIADMEVGGRPTTRVDTVKHVVGDFVERRINDRLGLILFGSQAYLHAPLTFDRATVNDLLQEMQIGFAGRSTAIGDGIGLGVKRLRDRPESGRVLILLTDGANTAGVLEPGEAADLAKIAGVRVYTIGIGAEEMVEQTIFGPRTINPTWDLDEDSLRYIAEQTGGEYFRARSTKELVDVYRALDELEPIEQEDKVFRPVDALYFWPLAAALLLSFLLTLSFVPLRFPLHTSTKTGKL